MAIAGLGIYLVGLSKAGFGGGLGILTTPLAVIAFNRLHKEPVFAIGVVLPLLCAADLFSIYYYRGKARRQNLKYLLPGVVVGTIRGGAGEERVLVRHLVAWTGRPPTALLQVTSKSEQPNS